MSIAAEPPTAPPMIAEWFDVVEVGSGGLAVLLDFTIMRTSLTCIRLRSLYLYPLVFSR